MDRSRKRSEQSTITAIHRDGLMSRVLFHFCTCFMVRMNFVPIVHEFRCLRWTPSRPQLSSSPTPTNPTQQTLPIAPRPIRIATATALRLRYENAHSSLVSLLGDMLLDGLVSIVGTSADIVWNLAVHVLLHVACLEWGFCRASVGPRGIIVLEGVCKIGGRTGTICGENGGSEEENVRITWIPGISSLNPFRFSHRDEVGRMLFGFIWIVGCLDLYKDHHTLRVIIWGDKYKGRCYFCCRSLSVLLYFRFSRGKEQHQRDE